MTLGTEYLAVLASAGLPVTLIVLFLLFRWRYLSVVRRTIYPVNLVEAGRAHGPEAVATRSGPLVLAWADVSPLGQGAQALERSTMAHEARAMRTVLSVSAAVFVLFTAVVVWQGQRSHFASRVVWTLAYFSTLSGMVILLAFTRPSWRWGLAIACAWLVLGVAFFAGVLDLRWSQIPSLMWAGLVFGSPPLAAVALLTLRRLRPLLVAFVPLVGLLLLISGVVIGLLEFFGVKVAGTPSKTAVAIGLFNLVVGVGVAIRMLRRGVRPWALAALLLAASSGVFVAPRSVPALWMIPAGIGVNAVGALAVGWLFLRFLRLKASGWLPDEILHLGFCWLVLTAFVPTLANSPLWPPWFLLPFVAWVTALSVLLSRRPRTAAAPAKRLLLLRVFEHPRRRRRLLDLLDDSWRRVGRVDLVVGVDFADRTLSPAALENFLFGRVHRQFVRTAAESVQRVARLSNQRAVDGRFPLNELHCLPHIWPHVVTELARACDVVLMDLRGLRRDNAGALFELALIIDRVALDRIVLLVDRRTDETALSETAQQAWLALTHDSPNAGRATPRLDLLRCAGSRADEPAITHALYQAAYRTASMEYSGADDQVARASAVNAAD